nr:hypothetical protein [Tanacetum cinerariifolium]
EAVPLSDEEIALDANGSSEGTMSPGGSRRSEFASFFDSFNYPSSFCSSRGSSSIGSSSGSSNIE